MKKKLSILIYSLAGGGAERVVSVLLSRLQNSFDITLVLMNETIEYDIADGVKVHFLEKSNPKESGLIKLVKLPLLAYKYRSFCKKESIDISLSFMNRPNYINVLSGVNCAIINERAMPSLQYGYDSLQSKINKILISSLYKKAFKVLSNSFGNRDDLINSFGVKSVDVIYNPVDIDKINKLASSDIDFDFEPFTFVTIGRLDVGKNHSLMIEAFSRLTNVNTQLLIIGDGDFKDVLQDKINQLGMEDKVVLLGKQANPYKYLSRSDCFTFSSNHEGFPNVLLEALACKLPIVSTDCQSGPREILKDEYGILTKVSDVDEFYEAMTRMVEDESLRHKFSSKAEIRVKDFNVDIISAEYEKALMCAQ